MLSDLLPVLRVPYYRFNPQVPVMSLDEIAPHKLRELQAIGRALVQAGRGKENTPPTDGGPSAPPGETHGATRGAYQERGPGEDGAATRTGSGAAGATGAATPGAQAGEAQQARDSRPRQQGRRDRCEGMVY